MTLTCGPPPENINVGQILGFEWKFKELEINDNERIKITLSNMTSMLTIKNTILPDIGKSQLVEIRNQEIIKQFG